MLWPRPATLIAKPSAVFGLHRMYMGKWLSGIVYLLTGGLFLVGILYDFWTLNDQITLVNQKQ
jgi:TM2 domain-containing membrane protein YozV